jgi:acyl-CoA thioesterase FadM
MSGDHEVAPDLLATEFVVHRDPFTVRRRVRWSDCDPAGVVYAGNFTEYLLSATDLFKQNLKVGGRIMTADHREYHTPGKALSLVYLSPLWPDDVFDIAVYAGRVGTRTSDVLALASRVDDQSPVFMGRMTSIYVSRADRRQTVAIPDEVREIFGAYQVRNPAPQSLIDAVAR